MSQILIAETNAAVSQFLKKELNSAQTRVDIVTSGQDAWEAIHATEYDVVMVNIMMPGLDSFVLAQRILRQNPGAQVIFITGFAAVAMDTYNTPTYAPQPMTSQPFHLKEMARRVKFYMGEGDLPMESFYGHMNAVEQDNVIYARFGS